MKYWELSQTGIRPSVAGLGGGGRSALGTRSGETNEHSRMLVARALELGINLFDTAEVYGTEHIIAAAIDSGDRSELVLSTKTAVRADERIRSVDDVLASLRQSLSRLHTDYVDIYCLHAVSPADYSYARDTLLPALTIEKEKGTVGLIGISEAFDADKSHKSLARAVADGCWDVIYLGFNILNQVGRSVVLKRAIELDIAVIGMCAVRHDLASRTALNRAAATLAGSGDLGSWPDLGQGTDLASHLLSLSSAESVPEIAYRFAMQEPGIEAVLFGTGNMKHLEQNVSHLLAPPLPDAATETIRCLFGRPANAVGRENQTGS